MKWCFSLVRDRRVSAVATALVLLAGSAWAEEGALGVSVLGNAPAENVVASFEGAEPDGIGWHREAAEWQDVAVSFRSDVDGEFRRATFRVFAIKEGFLEEKKFRLEVYENESDTESPVKGKKLYSGTGRMALQKTDSEMFLSIDLGDAIALTAGTLYTLVLSWEEPAPVVILQADSQYTAGRTWMRNERTDGEFIIVNTSSRPGLTFYLQNQ